MAVGVGGDMSGIAEDYLVDNYLNDTRNYVLKKSVHIEADFDRRFPVQETAWLADLNTARKIPSAIVAYAALEDPAVEDLLRQHLGTGGPVKGIRQILCWHENPSYRFVARSDLMRNSQWRAGFAKLSKYGLSFDLMVYPHQLDDAADLAAAFPETSIIVNHGAMPIDRSADGLRAWRNRLRVLARCENVAMKVSGLGQTNWAWTEDTMLPVVRDLVEIFGPRRAMFASNFPVDRTYSSFDRLYQAFEAAVADLSSEEQHDLFYATADRVYRLQDIGCDPHAGGWNEA